MTKQKWIHITDILSAYQCAGLSIVNLPSSPDGAPAQSNRNYSDPMKEVVRFVSQTNYEDPQHLSWKLAQDSLEKQFSFLKKIAEPNIDESMSDTECRNALSKWQENVINQFGPWHEVKTAEECPGNKRCTDVVIVDGIACRNRTEVVGIHSFVLN